MTIKSFQGLGLVNHNIPPHPKKKIVNCRKTSKKDTHTSVLLTKPLLSIISFFTRCSSQSIWERMRFCSRLGSSSSDCCISGASELFTWYHQIRRLKNFHIRLNLVCHFFIFTTFWCQLCSVTEQTHGKMKSTCWAYKLFVSLNLWDVPWN